MVLYSILFRCGKENRAPNIYNVETVCAPVDSRFGTSLLQAFRPSAEKPPLSMFNHGHIYNSGWMPDALLSFRYDV